MSGRARLLPLPPIGLPASRRRSALRRRPAVRGKIAGCYLSNSAASLRHGRRKAFGAARNDRMPSLDRHRGRNEGIVGA